MTCFVFSDTVFPKLDPRGDFILRTVRGSLDVEVYCSWIYRNHKRKIILPQITQSYGVQTY